MSRKPAQAEGPLLRARGSRALTFVVAGVSAVASAACIAGSEPVAAVIFALVAAIALVIAATGADRPLDEALEGEPARVQIGIPIMVFAVIIAALIVGGIVVAAS